MTDELATCCVIECGIPADVEIVANTGNYEDYTHSCLEHVGDLLGSILEDAEWGSYDWTITVIPEEEEPVAQPVVLSDTIIERRKMAAMEGWN